MSVQVLPKDGNLFGIGEPSVLLHILSLLWPFYLMHTLHHSLPKKSTVLLLCVVCASVLAQATLESWLLTRGYVVFLLSW